MEIEAGKFYRCRDGSKAHVTGRKMFTDDPGEYWMGDRENTGYKTWYKDGHYSYEANEDSSHDLVAEWEEPKKEGEPDQWFYANIDRNEIASSLYSESELNKAKDNNDTWYKIPAYKVEK